MRKLFSTARFALKLGGGIRGAFWKARQIYSEDGLVGIYNAIAFLSRHSGAPDSNPMENFQKVDVHSAWLRAQVERAGAIDPRINLVPLYERDKDPLARPFSTALGFAFQEVLSHLREFEINSIVCVPINGIGGADKVARDLSVEILRQEPGKQVLMLETISVKPDLVSLSSDGYLVGNIFQARFGLSEDEKILLLKLVISTLQPERVINVNSEICWKLFSMFAEYLKLTTKISAAFFCADFDLKGYDRGYSVQYFGTVASRLDYLISDNGLYVAQLERQFGIDLPSTSKLITLYQPVDLDSQVPVLSAPNQRNRVLWAARICRQKGIELLPEIAMICEELEFHVYGTGWIVDEKNLKRACPKNVIFYGQYDGMSEALQCNPTVFLHNALWDGIPNTLLEVGAAGVPIVASAVGAIPDLLGDSGERAILVDNPESAIEFAAAIRTVVANESLASSLAAGLSRHLSTNHSRMSYSETVREFLSGIHRQ